MRRCTPNPALVECMPDGWSFVADSSGAWILNAAGQHVCSFAEALERGWFTEVDELGDLGVRP